MKLPVQVALGGSLLALSGIALGYGLLEQAEVLTCASGACSGAALYPLGRSLYLWGALYYAVAGGIVFSGRSKHAAALLAAGSAAHTSLVIYGWICTETLWFCPRCIGLWLALVCLAVASFLVPHAMEEKKKLGFSCVLAAGLVAWFLISPAQLQRQAAVACDSVPLYIALERRDVGQTGKLAVERPDGEEVLLDLRERPALLFAWWCSHCAAALEAAAGLPEGKRPYLVATYLRGDDTPKIEEKLREASLAGPCYLLPGEPPVGEVPALLWWESGGLKAVQGGGVVQQLKGLEGALQARKFSDSL